jgi:polyhydroxybutyrate depolymerase
MKQKTNILPEERSMIVQGVERQILVYKPEQIASNIVLVFHGNGGTALGFANKYHLHNHLTESITIYIQGIPGIGGGFDPKGLKNGWQRKVGDGADRDLHFIDVLVPQLRLDYPDLKEKIFAFGHSNGGRFVYLLWSMRAEYFKGFIINAHQGVDLLTLALARRAMVLTGKQDKVVNNANQLKSAEMVKEILQIDESRIINEQLTVYSNSHSGYFLYHYIHPGGHDVPKSALPFVDDFLLKP